MLKVNYFLCADSAALDSRRNTLSAFHIVENINAPTIPFVIPRICVLASFERSLDENSLFQISLAVTQGGDPIFNAPVALNFAHQLASRVIIEVGGLVIPQPGKLKFALVRDSREIVFSEITVERLDGPTVEQLPFPAESNTK